jgi:hypothetical protein
MHTLPIKKQPLSRKLALLIAGFTMFGATLLASPDTQALDCNDISMLDSKALGIINALVAGKSFKIGPAKGKTVVFKSIESITGSDCDVVVKANIKVKRKLRKDANGTATFKGKLDITSGKICITNAVITDLHLSHTLDVGEEVYKVMAGKINKCL